MIEPRVLEAGEAPESVGVHRRARRDMLLDKGGHRGPFEVPKDAHSHAARAITPPLHGDQHRDRVAAFKLAAASEARLRAPNPGVVHLDLPAQRLTGD